VFVANPGVFYKAREAGFVSLQPWVKRSMVQSFQFFRLHSVPSSCNDWTFKATETAKPRREEACAVCAVKDWLENRYPVRLFDASTSTTTWNKFFFAIDGGVDEDDHMHDPDGEDDQQSSGGAHPASDASGGAHPAAGTLLVDGNGAFCVGPKDKVHAILDVQRYITTWPLIPTAELHASSVQHPDDLGMRWLLHTRRVKCTPASDVAQLAEPDILPKSAGIGDKHATVWCCKRCVESLCTEHPKMPPLALANAFFGGRHHPVFREATLASRMLSSSARLIMRQLFLGRGAHDESQKGMTGNTMLISQPSPSYDQVLPDTKSLSQSLVVLFCKSVHDVSNAQMLVVDREQYRQMVTHRQKVCPTFARSTIDEQAIDRLPDSAVPEALIKSAQAVPEAANVQTVLHGPANRVPMSHRQEMDDSDYDNDNDNDGGDSGVDAPHAPQAPTAAAANPDAVLPEVLNENETIIGIGQDSCPKPLRLFEAWNANMSKLNAEAAKVAQAEMQKRCGGEHPTASSLVTQVASKELVRTSIAVDMIDIAKGLSKSSKTRAELQSLVTGQTETEQLQPQEALAVPSGKPLSIFDASALPAAYTEFLFGDCVPFLKRETSVTVQQIFDALPSREELEYDLEDDEHKPYRASDTSRWDTSEFYAVATSFLRSLRILQSVKGAMDRPGFEKDFRVIAATTSEDFADAAMHPSAPRSNEDLIRTAGNERVRTALRHLGFSTATVPLTDGNKMRLHHLGCAMNQVFGPLTIFHTHNYADNYSPEIVKLRNGDECSGYIQNTLMPTLQKMHQLTAASPRSTAKLFLLMEELSYRHLYRVDRAWLGNFKISSPTSFDSREDDFASNGLRGLADFVTALFKCIEAQMRGFAHGHGKVHSIPDGVLGLLQCLKDVVEQINTIIDTSGGEQPAEEVVDSIVASHTKSYNSRLIQGWQWTLFGLFGVRARCSVFRTCEPLFGYLVPGIWYLSPGTWYLVPVTRSQVPEHLFRCPESLFGVFEHLLVFGEQCSLPNLV
jgi:hypothetical protein